MTTLQDVKPAPKVKIGVQPKLTMAQLSDKTYLAKNVSSFPISPVQALAGTLLAKKHHMDVKETQAAVRNNYYGLPVQLPEDVTPFMDQAIKLMEAKANTSK